MLADRGPIKQYLIAHLIGRLSPLGSPAIKFLSDGEHFLVDGDLDGDGNIDLVTTNSGSGDVGIRFGMGMERSRPHHRQRQAAVRCNRCPLMNADQKIDLVTAHNNSFNVKLIKATAARTYAVPPPLRPLPRAPAPCHCAR